MLEVVDIAVLLLPYIPSYATTQIIIITLSGQQFTRLFMLPITLL